MEHITIDSTGIDISPSCEDNSGKTNHRNYIRRSKICRGIQHICVLKGLDRNNDLNNPATPRKYRCVLNNKGTSVSIYADIDPTEDWKTVEGNDYAFAKFPPEETYKLQDGTVSLSVFDLETKEVLYFKKQYTKVFTTAVY